MNIRPTPIAGLMIVATEAHVDQRGSFTRLHCQKELEVIIGSRQIVQINHSISSKVGSVRGMHYQVGPQAEMKLVRCLQGKVWDVAVDLRSESSSFLQWHAQEISRDNALMMVIPEGCAHGFQVLEPDSELLYLHTTFYDADAEAGICPVDPELSINWPLPPQALSARDRNHPPLHPDYAGLVL